MNIFREMSSRTVSKGGTQTLRFTHTVIGSLWDREEEPMLDRFEKGTTNREPGSFTSEEVGSNDIRGD